MATQVAINGFGRIGRLCLRSMLERHRNFLSVVAINDMADLETNAHLFQYDSTYGPFSGTLEIGEGVLKVDGWNVTVLNQTDPSRLPGKNWESILSLSPLASSRMEPKSALILRLGQKR
jgi:glyceraldehyde 3-phosphate dehydrogenase